LLLGKIIGRLDSWTSKTLSFASRLQLLTSILYSLQVFWTRLFILPKKIIKDITQKFNRFLWNGKDGEFAKEKVAWDEICFPKKRGWFGAEKLGSLEHLCYVETCMEFVCTIKFFLGCLGSRIFAEREKLSEYKHSPKLLLELEEATEDVWYCQSFPLSLK
jgi:hypothetical protein